MCLLTDELVQEMKKKSIKIVATPDTLWGAPRLADHRIGVNHIIGCLMCEEAVELVKKRGWSYLSSAQIRAALRYAMRQVEKQRATV